jgi:hypothetical protein
VQGDSFSWYGAWTPPTQSDYAWTAEFDAGGRSYEVIATVDRVPGSRPRTGSLGELLNSAIRALHLVDPDSSAPHQPVRGAVVRIEQEPGGFRMVLRESSVIAALRRDRPGTARLRFRPCARTEGEAAERCVDERVPIEYR